MKTTEEQKLLKNQRDVLESQTVVRVVRILLPVSNKEFLQHPLNNNDKRNFLYLPFHVLYTVYAISKHLAKYFRTIFFLFFNYLFVVVNEILKIKRH